MTAATTAPIGPTEAMPGRKAAAKQGAALGLTPTALSTGGKPFLAVGHARLVTCYALLASPIELVFATWWRHSYVNLIRSTPRRRLPLVLDLRPLNALAHAWASESNAATKIDAIDATAFQVRTRKHGELRETLSFTWPSTADARGTATT